jgi:hypothetical protein
MLDYLERMLEAMRPAFSRRTTFVWFVVAFAGFVVRTDSYGVSSIVRALWLDPSCYPCLLNFFHSSAWTARGLLEQWWQFLAAQKAACPIGDRTVLLGDHTKTVKDGRRMPGLSTLHQDSETGSKPSFFRGHHWGCICMAMRRGPHRFFATPLWAEIHNERTSESRAVRIVTVGLEIARALGQPAYLVLDAFFASGPVFEAAEREGDFLKIVTRAKKSYVGYLPPQQPGKRKPGRPRRYGEKLKLIDLFDGWTGKFETAETIVYGKIETVRYLTIDLLWKPVKGTVRFFLIESSRGRIVLMTSDLSMEPLVAINLYCRRVSIETLFDTLKNLLGAMQYHFWSKYLRRASRRPVRNMDSTPVSTRPRKTKNTLAAIEKFVAVELLVVGCLQLLACRFATLIDVRARCWLRTPCGPVPSEFVTRTALSNMIRGNLIGFAKDMMTQLILGKQKRAENTGYFEDAA